MSADPASTIEKEFIRSALALASKKEVDRLLWVHDDELTKEELKGRPVKKKIVYAVSEETIAEDLRESGQAVVTIPPYDYARVERIKVAIVSALAAGLVKEGEVVLAVTGAGKHPDMLLNLRIGLGLEDKPALEGLELSEEFSSQVVEAFIDIALRVGHDGFEGHPIGSLITIGDATTVMEKSQQLTLNPFQGVSESERSVLDPRIREAIRNFSVLDGAFVAREDGVILAAGRYLQADIGDVKVPLGLGARHMAAAAITRETHAIAVTVSQTSGAVRVFRNGEIVLELNQPARRA
ncbi:MAG: diadenylate cyclase [Deltaproteobacteria bacterium]|nr:diadenylate cyclase [Deltaproteobacteria bacterium]